jgi:hypothetical protein
VSRLTAALHLLRRSWWAPSVIAAARSVGCASYIRGGWRVAAALLPQVLYLLFAAAGERVTWDPTSLVDQSWDLVWSSQGLVQGTVFTMYFRVKKIN